MLFSRSVVSDSLGSHGLQHASPLCPSPSPKVCPSLCPLHGWCHSAISSFDVLFSFCPQSFPASGTFPMSQLFTSDDQNTGASASASVLPTSIQGWFHLRFPGLISFPRDFQESSPAPQFKGINSLVLLPSLWSRSHNCTWPLGRPQLWLYRPLSAE